MILFFLIWKLFGFSRRETPRVKAKTHTEAEETKSVATALAHLVTETDDQTRVSDAEALQVILASKPLLAVANEDFRERRATTSDNATMTREGSATTTITTTKPTNGAPTNREGSATIKTTTAKADVRFKKKEIIL